MYAPKTHPRGMVVWSYKFPLYPTSEEELPLAFIPIFGCIEALFYAKVPKGKVLR
jgi:hypothetical protein